MAKYGLEDKHDEAIQKEYSLSDLDKYLASSCPGLGVPRPAAKDNRKGKAALTEDPPIADSTKPAAKGKQKSKAAPHKDPQQNQKKRPDQKYWTQENFRHDAVVADRKCIPFLCAHGRPNTVETSSYVVHTNGASAENTERKYSTRKLYPLMEPKAQVFSYLQLLCYILRKSSELSLRIEKFLDLFDHPSVANIPLYEKILYELKPALSSEIKDAPNDIICRAHAIENMQEYISTVAYYLYADYWAEPEALCPNVNCYLRAVKEGDIGFRAAQQYTVKSYIDFFYIIVARARAIALPSEILTSFRVIENLFSVEVGAKGEYERMLDPNCRKVTKEDCDTLSFCDGAIVPKTAKSICDLELPEDHTIYLDALEKYIYSNIKDITQKVFCLESTSVDRGHIRRVRSHINRVCGYWKSEACRSKAPCAISKAKLISLFQALFLSSPQARCDMQQAKKIKGEDKGVQDVASHALGPYFLDMYDNLNTIDSICHQLICVWVDYQTLVNSANSECAKCYLDINIAALEALLNEYEDLSIPAIQERSEVLMHYTVRTLIREENDETELKNLAYTLLTQYGIMVLTTGHFRRMSALRRFGAYCRLFSVTQISHIIFVKIAQWDRQGLLEININPLDTGVNERPLYLYLSYQANTHCFVFNDFSDY